MKHAITAIVRQALSEDVGSGDITVQATIPAHLQGTFHLKAREACVLCGLDVVAEVFSQLSPQITLRPQAGAEEGASLRPGQIIATIHGPAGLILTGERVALNLLQRMCGIATLTQHYVEAVQGTRAKIRDTRKTMPGLRVLDKMAVRAGGGVNHRMGLYDEILIKDNHIAACGSVTEALRRAAAASFTHSTKPITLECDTLAQVQEALASGVAIQVLLLDNMDVTTLREAVKLVGGIVLLEASGGITLHNVKAIAQTGVDYIAIGALTHSARAIDIGLDEA